MKGAPAFPVEKESVPLRLLLALDAIPWPPPPAGRDKRGTAAG